MMCLKRRLVSQQACASITLCRFRSQRCSVTFDERNLDLDMIFDYKPRPYEREPETLFAQDMAQTEPTRTTSLVTGLVRAVQRDPCRGHLKVR